MRVINAEWEKRNLDVVTQEISVDFGDSLDELTDAIGALDSQYTVVKIPASMTDFFFRVHDLGFKYIETNIQLVKKLKDAPILPAIYSRYEKEINYHLATNAEVQHTLDEIKKGRIFTTDKISRDPRFSCELSGKRYALWTMDLLRDRGRVYIATYKDKSIGFAINCDDSTYYEAFLTGLFAEYLQSGLGFIPLYATTSSVYERGGRLIKTGVSSNNISILRLHQVFGYEVSGMTEIFIRHI